MTPKGSWPTWSKPRLLCVTGYLLTCKLGTRPPGMKILSLSTQENQNHYCFVCIVIWAATWENRIFAYAKTKTQISFAVTAKLISVFVFATRIIQSPLLPKIRNFKSQAIFSDCVVRFVQSDLVGNPEDRFSDVASHIYPEHLSCVMRKPAFCIYEHKSADQLPVFSQHR